MTGFCRHFRFSQKTIRLGQPLSHGISGSMKEFPPDIQIGGIKQMRNFGSDKRQSIVIQSLPMQNLRLEQAKPPVPFQAFGGEAPKRPVRLLPGSFDLAPLQFEVCVFKYETGIFGPIAAGDDKRRKQQQALRYRSVGGRPLLSASTTVRSPSIGDPNSARIIVRLLRPCWNEISARWIFPNSGMTKMCPQ